MDWKILYCPDVMSSVGSITNAIPIRIPADFFVEIEKLTLKFTLKCQGPRIAKITFKKTKLEDLYYLILRLILKLLYPT